MKSSAKEDVHILFACILHQCYSSIAESIFTLYDNFDDSHIANAGLESILILYLLMKKYMNRIHRLLASSFSDLFRLHSYILTELE
jgi:hypothetical protein